jgi:hypothetical protein
LLGKEDDSAAVRAGGEMRKRPILLVQRQSVLREGAELVCAGMLAGLEEVAHSEGSCHLFVAGCGLSTTG